MSSLRAKCPDCGTYTAVALGPDYQCHSCGREFTAGLVRVPRAWGEGGEAMAEAAHLALPYPEAAVVTEDTLAMQSLEIASDLPERPLVLGGCCCAHVGAVEALSARHDRLALVWVDAHGDLNTPQTSPSGNLWGMPLRMLVDSGAVAPADVALVAARNLDPPEEEFVATSGIHRDDITAALEGVSCVYVAVDLDALEPRHVAPFMPEPGGLTLAEAESLLRRVAARGTVVGVGFSGLLPDERNSEAMTRLAAALGL
jgi:arginase family enzyme